MKIELEKFAAAAVALVVLSSTTGAVADDDRATDLAARLAELRSEVDRLSDEVEDEKDDLDARMRSLRNQKADLEAQIKREETRSAQLNEALAEQRERLEEQREGQKDLTPSVERAIDTVRAPIETGLPFKRAERIAELDELEKQLDEGLLSPQKAVSRLWQFVEDELRLARENGLHRQIVEVDGEEVLADVARVGMIALFYRTEDGRVGKAQYRDGAWRWEKIDDDDQREHALGLFDSFKKNIRVGFFTMPNALPEGGRR